MLLDPHILKQQENDLDMKKKNWHIWSELNFFILRSLLPRRVDSPWTLHALFSLIDKISPASPDWGGFSCFFVKLNVRSRPSHIFHFSTSIITLEILQALSINLEERHS